MRAVGVDKTNAAVGVAEGDEVFVEDLDANGRAVVVRELALMAYGQPETPEVIARR
jgi:hypothetical protein